MKILMIVLCLVFVLHLSATIINIPDDYPTIQEGIDVSVNADTVLVQSGTYYENINYNGKAITVGSQYLTSQDSSYLVNTIIDGSNIGNIVIIEDVDDSFAILCGFTIQNGFSTHGGGIFCQNSQFSLNSIVLKNSEAIDQGGAIYCDNSSLSIENSIINNNNIEMGNGIIYCLNSEIFYNNLHFYDNYSWDGGGVVIWDSNIQINNSIFENNYNEMMGGAITLDNVIGTISDCIIDSNETAMLDAGGIWIHQSEIEIMNSSITNNVAPMGSGLSISYNSVVNLNNSIISGNNSGTIYSSEGLLSSNSNLNIDNCIIDNNSRGIVFNTGDLTINNSNLSNNNSNALWSNSSSAIIDSCYFSQNQFVAGANCGGGAIMILSAESFLITNSIFKENMISGDGGNIGGGAIYTYSDIEVKNCIFYENIANVSGNSNGGSAIYFNNSNSIISNCILWNNITTENGSVVSLLQESNPIFINSIIYNNSPNIIEFLETDPISYNTVSIYYSNIQNGEDIIHTNGFGNYFWDESNCDFNPLFVDIINGDFTLLPNSPCIDAGTPIGWLIPPNFEISIDDFLGYNAIGISYDIGVFEGNSTAIENYSFPLKKINIVNYPNPFNPSTTIEFSIQNSSKVELSIFNIKGQKIKTLVQNQLNEGLHSIIWNGNEESGNSVSSGIYYYKLNVNGKTEAVKKCLLLK